MVPKSQHHRQRPGRASRDRPRIPRFKRVLGPSDPEREHIVHQRPKRRLRAHLDSTVRPRARLASRPGRPRPTSSSSSSRLACSDVARSATARPRPADDLRRSRPPLRPAPPQPSASCSRSRIRVATDSRSRKWATATSTRRPEHAFVARAIDSGRFPRGWKLLPVTKRAQCLPLTVGQHRRRRRARPMPARPAGSAPRSRSSAASSATRPSSSRSCGGSASGCRSLCTSARPTARSSSTR